MVQLDRDASDPTLGMTHQQRLFIFFRGGVRRLVKVCAFKVVAEDNLANFRLTRRSCCEP